MKFYTLKRENLKDKIFFIGTADASSGEKDALLLTITTGRWNIVFSWNINL